MSQTNNPLKQYSKVPKIYVYTDKYNEPLGNVKVGMTTQPSAEIRVKQQTQTASSEINFTKILLEESAITDMNEVFSDHDVHRKLKEIGIERLEGEWFRCSLETVKEAMLSIKKNIVIEKGRGSSFSMRPEQQDAVDITYDYFQKQKINKNGTPHFLWNAKMRFGKTFATYKLAQKMGWKKILILTYKPAVAAAWKEDLETHIDFENWQFVNKESRCEDQDQSQSIVCFTSFQDILGKKAGEIKEANEGIFLIEWDCVILDEYHFGSWNSNSKGLFEKSSIDPLAKETETESGDDNWGDFNQNSLPLSVNHFLYLSGTPFRAIASGEFLEDQIFNWTYENEQRAKLEWKEPNNPYASLPGIQLLTYRLPDRIRDVAIKSDNDGFSLNEFFKAVEIVTPIVKDNKGNVVKNKKIYKFVYEKEVQSWLNILRGQEKMVNDLSYKADTVLPYQDTRLLGVLNHTFWFLPTVASCNAMGDLLQQIQNNFYSEYEILVCAGTSAGIGEKALEPIQKAIGDGLKTKTITLSCGKLTTGVSVPQWGGVFFLRDTTSPESYFQTAFRAQTPWTIKKMNSNDREIIKKTCFIFDFSPNRALNLIVDYTAKLDIKSGTNPEKKISDFINFLPVLCFEGEQMQELDATSLLDMAISGIGGTMLARKWQSPLMVDISDTKLNSLLENPELIKSLENLESFRNLKNLNSEITRVITSEKNIQKLKKEEKLSKDSELPEKEKKEKESNLSFKKKLKDCLIQFITKIPVVKLPFYATLNSLLVLG